MSVDKTKLFYLVKIYTERRTKLFRTYSDGDYELR